MSCLYELPVLAALEEEFASENLAVVTICLYTSTKEAREALQDANVEVLTLIDKKSDTMWSYQVSNTPTTYLIDATGVIQKYYISYGDNTEVHLRAEIKRLLEA